ncbi:MAG: RloB family protein, partial [Chitinophagales bacterium]
MGNIKKYDRWQRGVKQKKKRIKREITERPIRVKKYEYLFLIICEDEKTERIYFESFQKKIPPETLYLKAVGTGRDPQGVAERAIEEREKLSEEASISSIPRSVDKVWLVFDKDDADENEAKIQRFEKAFDIAKKEKFEIAYSNEVFEVWLLLHLIDVDSEKPLPRQEVYQLLQKHIQKHSGYETFEYLHGKSEILEKIQELGNEAKAIERAEKLLIKQNGHSPIKANPSTKVHLLVKELYAWIEYF